MRRFLNRYQGGFPVEEQPYADVAAKLGVDTGTLIGTIRDMLDEGILDRFGPLYDASSMGGSLTLAALSVPEERFDEVTEMVNAMPEVAHNYQREHELNMWFVLATETPQGIAETIAGIERSTGLPVYDMPKQEEFFVGLRFDV